MASASSSSSLGFRVLSLAPSQQKSPSFNSSRLFVGPTRPYLLRPPQPLSAAFSCRRNTSAASSSSKKKKNLQKSDNGEDDALDEDAFEALFSQLEEDLKNDNLLDGDFEDELTEEDLAMLEKELEDTLGGEDDDELAGIPHSNSDNMEIDADAEEDEEERPVKLKTWQTRRLAAALKIGRRKTSIKNLAAELGLDRAVVLELLRDPPPNLLLISASLPVKVEEAPIEPETKTVEPETSPKIEDVTKAEIEDKPELKAPVHVMLNRWSTKKRLKKVQIDTLERVYSRSKRPTNAMISSIVHVTNLPRKAVVKWFEDKRLQDGVPSRHTPFRRAVPETVSSNY